MKKKLMGVIVVLFSLVFTLALVACGGSGIKLDKTELSMTVGDTQTLKVTNEDGSAFDGTVTWSSSDAAVASVSSRGVVTAQKEGTATVTAEADSAKATCVVTVKAKEVITVEFTDEAGTKITSLSVERGETKTVKAVASNGGNATFAVSNGQYASVTQDGNTATVTGLFPTEENTGLKLYATVGSVRAELPVTVTFTNKSDTWYNMASDGEGGCVGQNKVELNKWAYWGDRPGWNSGNVVFDVAEYLGDSASSEAGSVHFHYVASAFGNYPTSCVQITYRSAGEGGKLKTGVYYKLTADITSSAAGVVTLNGTEITLTAGKNSVEVYFLHADDGRIYGETEYTNIYYTAIFLLMGAESTGTTIPEAEITIENLHWTEFTPEPLKAPTVTVSGKTVTIADTNSAEYVSGYRLGLFAEGGTAPVYVIPNAKIGANTVDDAKYDEGTYTARAMATGKDARHTDSAWSEDSAEYVVSHGGKTAYDLSSATEVEANTYPGIWYFNAETNGIENAKYEDGKISFTVTGGNNWYSNQLFYQNSRLAAGEYTISMKIKATIEQEGIVHLNGNRITLQNGENDITIKKYTQNIGGTTISLQMGEPTADYSGTTAVMVGSFEIYDIVYTAEAAEQPGAEYTPNYDKLTNAAEADAQNDEWSYWYVQDVAWNCGDVVNMTEAKIENGTITLTYTGGSAWYAIQLFYKNSALSKGSYKLTLKINVTKDCNITLNGTVVELHSGDNDVEVTFVNTAASALSLQMGTVNPEQLVTDITVKVSGVKWTALGGAPDPTPAEPLEGFEYHEESSVLNGWGYWNDQGWVGSNVTVGEKSLEKNDDGSFDIAVKFSVTGACDFGFQIFYNDPAHETGKEYRLTFKITSKTDCTITVNGKQYDLKAGVATDVDVTFTYNYNSADGQTFSLFDMQVKVADGDYDLTLENITWTEN